MSISAASSTRLPTIIFVAGFVVVALSTFLLPNVTGYGTVLYEVVVLGAWALLASVTSGQFADQHHSVLWPVALLLNFLIFAIVAAPTYLALRRRAPKMCAIVLLCWPIFYLCNMFLLFPAADGP